MRSHEEKLPIFNKKNYVLFSLLKSSWVCEAWWPRSQRGSDNSFLWGTRLECSTLKGSLACASLRGWPVSILPNAWSGQCADSRHLDNGFDCVWRATYNVIFRMAGGQLPVHHWPWAEVTVTSSPEWADSCGQGPVSWCSWGSVQKDWVSLCLRWKMGGPSQSKSFCISRVRKPQRALFFLMKATWNITVLEILYCQKLCLTLDTKIKRKQNLLNGYRDTFRWRNLPQGHSVFRVLPWWSAALEVECHSLPSRSSVPPQIVCVHLVRVEAQLG